MVAVAEVGDPRIDARSMGRGGRAVCPWTRRRTATIAQPSHAVCKIACSFINPLAMYGINNEGGRWTQIKSTLEGAYSNVYSRND